MNERIHLRFRDFDPAAAAEMTRIAASFAVVMLDKRTGKRRGVVYGRGPRRYLAYWTATRAVVVEELEPGPDLAEAVGAALRSG